jgi:predicted alpha-1,6-mannanase (GH76 family)
MKNLILIITITSLLKVSGVFGQELTTTYDWTDNGGTMSAEFPGDSPESVSYLFDNKYTTSYSVSGTTQAWFQYEAPAAIIVTSYLVVSSDSAFAPQGWTFECSDDGSTWAILKTESAQAFVKPQQAKPYLTSTSVPHKYWRLKVSSVAGGSGIKIADWQLFGYGASAAQEPDLTTNADLSKITYSASQSIGEPPSRVFDDAIGTKFADPAQKTYWIGYELPFAHVIDKYAITISCCSHERSPRSFQLLGSNDGTNWDIIDSRVNKNFFNNGSNIAPFNMQVYTVPKPAQNWASYADTAHQVLMSEYWNTGDHYFNQDNNKPTPHVGLNYWWQAHALDALVDAYVRTNDVKYKTRMDQLIVGLIAKNPFGSGSIKSNYFDDMEWMGLACLRAYYATNDIKWRDYAIQLWGMIKLGWDPSPKGGFHWTTDVGTTRTDTVINAISNSPASILASRLYKLTNDTEYLDWAKKAYNYVKDNFLDNTRGVIWDGYGHIGDNGWVFTYNQGVYIGAALELYKITQESAYLEEALRTATYVMNDRVKFSERGVIQSDAGSADGGLFKGIYVRYLAELIMEDDIGHANRIKLQNFIMDNGTSLWHNATLLPNVRFAGDWVNRTSNPVISSSNHISGIMLFEALDALKRKGYEDMVLASSQRAYKYIRLNVIANATGNTGGNNGAGMSEWQLYGGEPNPPLVTLTAPAGGTKFPFNPDITLDATVVDYPGLKKVGFYSGTTLIGTSTTSPYTFAWNNAPSGVHSITAKAFDDRDSTITSTVVQVTVAPDPSSQFVEITSPGNNQVFAPSTPITFDAEAANFPDIAKMEFYNGATLLGEDATSPYSFTWNPPAHPGAYNITVKAINDVNEFLISVGTIVIVSSETNPTVPSVKITSPTTGSTFEASTAITFTAEVLQVGITKLEFFNGGTLIGTDTEAPFSIIWNNPKSGINYITAKATNDKDETATSTVVQVIVNGGPVTDVEELLGQKNASYPNPFLDHVYIPLELKSRGSASIQIYNSAGQLIHTSTHDNLNAGQNYIELRDISNNSSQSGYYTYKVITNGETKSGTIIRMK